MTVLFALFKYFPWGGLQNDTLRFIDAMIERNHRAILFTTEWVGAPPRPELELEIVKVFGLANHAKMNSFAKKFQARLKRGDIDVSVAMNRIPGADFYFAADTCLLTSLKEKRKSFSLRFLPRYRNYLAAEHAIFRPGGATRILAIAPRQLRDFRDSYATEAERFLLLPPGMNPACGHPSDADEIRKAKRRELGIPENETVLILVGTNFMRKGMDRALLAVKNLKEKGIRCRLLIAGNDPLPAMNKRIREAGLSDSALFLGPRRDVSALLLASDLMIHPAREEGAGTVLIEALAAGIPVVCTGGCGFAHYVAEACGLVLEEPFSQSALETAAADALPRLPAPKKRVLAYAST